MSGEVSSNRCGLWKKCTDVQGQGLEALGERHAPNGGRGLMAEELVGFASWKIRSAEVDYAQRLSTVCAYPLERPREVVGSELARRDAGIQRITDRERLLLKGEREIG